MKKLTGAFQNLNASDPETILAGAMAILSRYPIEIAEAVCDPEKGLATRFDYFPPLAQITNACEALYAVDRRVAKLHQAEAAQLAERHEIEQAFAKRGDQTYEQLRAKLALVGIHIGEQGKPDPKLSGADLDDKPALYGTPDQLVKAQRDHEAKYGRLVTLVDPVTGARSYERSYVREPVV